MTLADFKTVVAEALEVVTKTAEERLNRELPRAYKLGWLGGPVMEASSDVVEALANKVFVGEDEIYPSVDLFLEELLPDNRLLVICYRARFQPCPFGEHWTYKTGGHGAGRVGPFKLGCGSLIEKLSPMALSNVEDD